MLNTRLRDILAAPLAAALVDYGLSFVVAPLPGARHAYMKHESGIAALFPFIDAPAMHAWHPGLIGAAVAAVHAATPFLDARLLATPEKPSPYLAFFERNRMSARENVKHLRSSNGSIELGAS